MMLFYLIIPHSCVYLLAHSSSPKASKTTQFVMSWIVVLAVECTTLFFAFVFDGVKHEEVEKARKHEDAKSHGRDSGTSLLPWGEYFFFVPVILRSPIKFPSFYQQVATTSKAGVEPRKQGRKEMAGIIFLVYLLGRTKFFFSFFGP
ncbi:hypothetical protein BKA57DRAFT_269187 [Linnemannia elongata]|nr:hypothetical protein BKA57DRAFT_269187 [Linnemannia elongata]